MIVRKKVVLVADFLISRPEMLSKFNDLSIADAIPVHIG